MLLPVAAQADVLFVDYEGVVNQAGANPAGYRVGDKIKGRLLVDLLLAPPNLFPTSELASYHYLPWEQQKDWVRGFTGPGGTAADRIFVRNDPSGLDSFSIGDRRDQGLDTFLGIELTVNGLELFPTNELSELGEFTVTRADKPATFAGDLRWGWGEAAQFVSFALKRFSVKPGRCAAPG
jgi:hypothetical protein